MPYQDSEEYNSIHTPITDPTLLGTQSPSQQGTAVGLKDRSVHSSPGPKQRPLIGPPGLMVGVDAAGFAATTAARASEMIALTNFIVLCVGVQVRGPKELVSLRNEPFIYTISVPYYPVMDPFTTEKNEVAGLSNSHMSEMEYQYLSLDSVSIKHNCRICRLILPHKTNVKLISNADGFYWRLNPQSY